MTRLSGKVAIVTGAGGGIGRAHALALAAEGASVVVNDVSHRRSADPAAVVDEIESMGGAAVASRASATWEGAPEIVQTAIDAFGRVDVLVNNATAARVDDLWRMSQDVWDLTMEVNLKGYFAMIRAVAPHLCAQGSGVIVNTSSGSGFGHPGNVAYATAKEGVIGLSRTVAQELGRFGVRCNAIRPAAAGRSFADMVAVTERWKALTDLTLGRSTNRALAEGVDADVHTPEKVATFVTWLCSDAAAGINGRTFNVAGDVISLLAEETVVAAGEEPGGWSLETLDARAATTFAAGLANEFRFDDHPELQVFEP